jgi:hypothetical protein
VHDRAPPDPTVSGTREVANASSILVSIVDGRVMVRHHEFVAGILHADRQGLFTVAEAAMLIDRVRTHVDVVMSTATAVRPPPRPVPEASGPEHACVHSFGSSCSSKARGAGWADVN